MSRNKVGTPLLDLCKQHNTHYVAAKQKFILRYNITHIMLCANFVQARNVFALFLRGFVVNTYKIQERKGWIIVRHTNVRDELIRQTISVVATKGMDKTTTKAIVEGTDINEAYIYRCFSDKEELLAKAFSELDCELVGKCKQCVEALYIKGLSREERCQLFFLGVWRFMLECPERCKAYLHYYYSPYFRRLSAGEHHERFLPLVNVFRKMFREKANVWMLTSHMLNVMLDFALKVFDGEVEDSDDTAEHVFRVLYYSVSPYFRQQGGTN